MLPFQQTFDHFRPTYTKDGAGGTIMGFTAVAVNQSCQVDAGGGGLQDRFGGDGMTSKVKLITTYSAIQNGDIVAIQSGSTNYFRILGGDDPMIGQGVLIPTYFSWDAEAFQVTT